MMIDCKYCGGTGKLHDDADAFDDHERDLDAHWRDRALQAESLRVKAMAALDFANHTITDLRYEVQRLTNVFTSPYPFICHHPVIAADVCRDCGAYVGPQP